MQCVASVGGASITNITENGSDSLYGEGILYKNILYIVAGWIKNGQIGATNGSGFHSTFTVWYDEGRTDGTRWDLGTRVKTEIYPQAPVLSIAPVNGQFAVSLTNGVPGATYALESAFPDSSGNRTIDPPGKKIKAVITSNPTVVGDDGTISWTIRGGWSGESNMFFRARLVTPHEPTGLSPP